MNKAMKYKKIGSWFFILMMLSGLILIFSPGILRVSATVHPGLSLLDTLDDGDDYHGVWCDGTYIYAACFGDGLRAYTFNENDTEDFWLKDTIDNGNGYRGVWGDGTYVYAVFHAGILAYSFDGTTFTLKDTIDDSFMCDVWGDGTYIYAVGESVGLYAYTFDGTNLASIDNIDDGEYEDVWGDGTYIYTASRTAGIRAYTFNENATEKFWLKSTHFENYDCYGVWGDGTYIYAVFKNRGIFAYSFDGTTFTLLDSILRNTDCYDVWGNGTYIYTAYAGDGLFAFSFDGADLTSIDNIDDGNVYGGVWANESYIFVGCYGDGIRAYDLDANIDPTITGENPVDTSTNIVLSPTCNVTVNDSNPDTMDVTFASNYSGSWVNYQTNTSVSNGSYSWSFTGANTLYTKYWWRVYCYDDNVNISETYSFTTTTGSIAINVYNETSPSTAIPDWNIRIYDGDNVIQYSKNNLNNPVTVNHTEYGTGVIFFEIGASGYYNRTYYANITNGIHYILNAFLLNAANTNAHIYTCIVIDDSDLDAILYINDATIVITRVINGSIHEVASGFTDGSGRFYVPLISGVSYNVNITATGYDNLYDTYVPSSTEFEQIFRMSATPLTSISYDEFWENISIDISMVSAGCMQDGNITITYLDSNSSTTNTEIRLFEIYGPNSTLLNTWTNTSNSFFNINSSINTTRVHYMSLYFNNTAFFTVSQPITIMIPNVDSPFCDRVDPFDLDDRITDIVGPFTIDGHEVPWTIVIGTIVPIIILVSFGPFNTGLGILGCGISMAMMQGFLDMFVTGGFQWGIVGIGAFIAILGIMYIMTKGTGGDHL